MSCPLEHSTTICNTESNTYMQTRINSDFDKYFFNNDMMVIVSRILELYDHPKREIIPGILKELKWETLQKR